MSLYFEFLKKAFQERYAYRFDFYASIVGNIVGLFIQISVWTALFQNSPSQIISLSQMLSYTLISSLILTLTTSRISEQLSEKIANGNIMMDFLRPISLKAFFLADGFGRNVSQTIFATLPALVFGVIFMNIQFTVSFVTLVYFFISLVFAILIAFYFHYIVGLFSFWLETTWYIRFFSGAIIQLFSGATVPLWFYPDWLYRISAILPFRLIFFDPISIYLNQQGNRNVFQILFFQVTWICFFWCLERVVWKFVKKKVVIHGG